MGEGEAGEIVGGRGTILGPAGGVLWLLFVGPCTRGIELACSGLDRLTAFHYLQVIPGFGVRISSNVAHRVKSNIAAIHGPVLGTPHAAECISLRNHGLWALGAYRSKAPACNTRSELSW